MLIAANLNGFNSEKWEPDYKFYNLWEIENQIPYLVDCQIGKPATWEINLQDLISSYFLVSKIIWNGHQK